MLNRYIIEHILGIMSADTSLCCSQELLHAGNDFLKSKSSDWITVTLSCFSLYARRCFSNILMSTSQYRRLCPSNTRFYRCSEDWNLLPVFNIFFHLLAWTRNKMTEYGYSYCSLSTYSGSWGSSVSTVSDYGLDWEIEVRSPAEAKDFPSNLCVQTGSGAHPACCTMGTGGPFLGSNARPERDADHSPLF
jgi:hypothetical protein